jgi:hypothetical protein
MNGSFTFHCLGQRIEVDAESINDLTLTQLTTLAEATASAVAKYGEQRKPDQHSLRLTQWAANWNTLAVSTINQRLIDQQQQLLNSINSISDSIDDLSSRLRSLDHKRSLIDALW